MSVKEHLKRLANPRFGLIMALSVSIIFLSLYWTGYHSVDISYNHFLLERNFNLQGNKLAVQYMETLCDQNGAGDCPNYEDIYPQGLLFVSMGMFGFAGAFFLAGASFAKIEIKQDEKQTELKI